MLNQQFSSDFPWYPFSRLPKSTSLCTNPVQANHFPFTRNTCQYPSMRAVIVSKRLVHSFSQHMIFLKCLFYRACFFFCIYFPLSFDGYKLKRWPSFSSWCCCSLSSWCLPDAAVHCNNVQQKKQSCLLRNPADLRAGIYLSGSPRPSVSSWIHSRRVSFFRALTREALKTSIFLSIFQICGCANLKRRIILDDCRIIADVLLDCLRRGGPLQLRI